MQPGGAIASEAHSSVTFAAFINGPRRAWRADDDARTRFSVRMAFQALLPSIGGASSLAQPAPRLPTCRRAPPRGVVSPSCPAVDGPLVALM